MKVSFDEISSAFEQTINLISLYKKLNLTIPFALKGNLGEFIIAKELMNRFPKSTLNFHGGAFPGSDMNIDNIRVQVKTQIKHSRKYRSGEFDFESSPTIKKSIIDDKMCDIIGLVILYLNENYSTVEKHNIYIFEQKDFSFFNTRFCWSGNSKGDYTIVNVLKVEGEPPNKLKEVIEFYNSDKYRNLFKDSKDNWSKIGSLIHSFSM